MSKLEEDYLRLEETKTNAVKEVDGLKKFLELNPLIKLKETKIGIYLKPKAINNSVSLVLDFRLSNYPSGSGIEVSLNDVEDMIFGLKQIKDIKEMTAHELLNYYKKKEVLEKIQVVKMKCVICMQVEIKDFELVCDTCKKLEEQIEKYEMELEEYE